MFSYETDQFGVFFKMYEFFWLGGFGIFLYLVYDFMFWDI